VQHGNRPEGGLPTNRVLGGMYTGVGGIPGWVGGPRGG